MMSRRFRGHQRAMSGAGARILSGRIVRVRARVVCYSGIPSAAHLRPIGKPRNPRNSAAIPPVSELTDLYEFNTEVDPNERNPRRALQRTLRPKSQMLQLCLRAATPRALCHAWHTRQLRRTRTSIPRRGSSSTTWVESSASSSGTAPGARRPWAMAITPIDAGKAVIRSIAEKSVSSS